ncbi:MAG: hypothetical protein AB7V53_16910, partial [Dongiaceae bacterium]
MKIAVGIIGIVIGLLALLQSCVATTAGRLAQKPEMVQAASLGVGAAFFTFIAGAFAFGLPLVAAIIFVLAALMAFMAAGAFPDMGIWGAVDIILAAMSLFAWHRQR